ncbi:hypothetical protein E2320_020000 [Naja naja]|nr:hypothetical protein E2320_020000 [Naja naja]
MGTDKKNEKALANIILALEGSQQIHSRGLQSVKECWEALHSVYVRETAGSKPQLKLEESMSKHLQAMRKIFLELEERGITFTEAHKVYVVLSSLDTSWDILVTSLESMQERDLTMVCLTGQLLEEEQKQLERQLEKEGNNAQHRPTCATFQDASRAAETVYTVKRGFTCGSTEHLQRHCPERRNRTTTARNTRNTWLLDSGARGARYTVVIVDDYTRYGFCYLLKSRTEILQHFKQWVRLVERRRKGQKKARKLRFVGYEPGSQMESERRNYAKSDEGETESRSEVDMEEDRSEIKREGRETQEQMIPRRSERSNKGIPHDRFTANSVVEPEQQWPWKEVTFQDAFFSRNKFEPFLRRVCKVQPPELRKDTIDYSVLLEKAYTTVDFKEQEDQDPPPGLPLTKLDNGLDPKLIKSGEQLSILRLLEKKIDLQQEDKKIAVETERETKPSIITSESKPQGDKLSEAEIKQVNVYFKNSLETFLVDKVVKVVALKSLLSKNIENLVAERFSGPELPQELEDSSPLDDREKCSLKEITTTTDAFSEPDISELKDVVSQHLQAQLIGKLSEKGIIPDMVIAENQVSLQSSSDLLRKALSKEVTSQTEIITIKPLSESDIRELSKSESLDNKESHKSKPVSTEADLYESRKDYHEPILFPLESQTSSENEPKFDLKNIPSNTSLEIIRVKLPFSIETANIKKHVSLHDTLLQKILKAEIKSLKSFLSKSIQDHLKDKLSETGLSKEDLETVCQKLSLNLKEKSNEGFDDSVLSKSIQNLFEALSENEISNLKSALNRKIQNYLSERISEIGLITQEELKKILEMVFPVVAKETALRAEKGPDLAKEEQSVQQVSHITHTLQDRFSEEELQNLKSLCSRLLKEGQREQLSELEVKGLASVLQKSFEELPVPISPKTLISKEIDKDMDHDASVSSVESISKVSDVDLSDKAKHPSYENLPHTSTASEKCKKENLGGLINSIFEVQTKNQETQTSGCKKVKHTCKKERYKLPGYPDNLEISDLKRRSYEEISQNKPQKESLRKISEPFAFSSFLSAHDIGAQTEIKNYLSKTPNYPSKPPFPVNPQTFLFLHPESEEEAKPTCKYHHKTKTKKTDRKKDAALHHSQQGGTNPSAKKEKAHRRSSKDVLKEKHGKKHGELSSKKSSTTETRKDSKTLLSGGGVKKESMKLKPEKKRDNDIKQKKSFSKTTALSDSQLSKTVQEKSTIKFPTTGHTKANSLNSIAIEDLDLEAYKHLEKAIERALVDLQGVEEGSCSQARSNSAPNVAGLMSKDALRPFPSAPETPRNQAGMIFDMLNNQDQILKMTPEQLEVVLKILHKILRQNSRPPNNG